MQKTKFIAQLILDSLFDIALGHAQACIPYPPEMTEIEFVPVASKQIQILIQHISNSTCSLKNPADMQVFAPQIKNQIFPRHVVFAES